MFKHSGFKEAFFMESLGEVQLLEKIHQWNCRHNTCSIMALVAERDSANIHKLQEICKAEGVELFGAVFPGLLKDSAVVNNGILIARLDGIPRPRLFEDVSLEARVPDVADDIAGWVDRDLSADEGALFVLFDVAVSNVSSHLDAWHARLGDWVRYYGVNVGSETFQASGCLFDTDRVIASGLLVMLLPHHPGAAVMHGFTPPADFRTVTAASNNRVVQVDWLPAVQIYQDMIRDEYGVEVTVENFYQYATHYPFGLLRADGEILVRIPVAMSGAEGVVCAGEIPANSILTLLDASQSTNVAVDLADELRRRGRGPQDETLLVFYCGGRLLQKGDAAKDELADLIKHSGAARLFGAVSLGEIGTASAGGYPLFHNAALLALP